MKICREWCNFYIEIVTSSLQTVAVSCCVWLGLKHENYLETLVTQLKASIHWRIDKHYWDISTNVSQQLWEYMSINLKIRQRIDDHVHQFFGDCRLRIEQEIMKKNDCCTTFLRLLETFERKQANFILQAFAKWSPLVWLGLYGSSHKDNGFLSCGTSVLLMSVVGLSTSIDWLDVQV